MARVVLALEVLLVGFLIGAAYLPAAGKSEQPQHPGDSNLVLAGTVTRVIDGDGAKVRLDSGPIEVRFYGIDAPEFRAPFGRKAKQALGRLIANRDVELVPEAQDRYDRMVAVVLLEGASVNEKMIAEGYAWAYRDYLGQIPGGEHYCELEAQARAAHLGLWSQPTELWVPPWIYRERVRRGPGAKVPSRDYAQETAADCIAAIKELRPVPGPQNPLDPQCVIKGNISSKGEKIYHVPGDPNYVETRIDPGRGERWFCTEEEARAAGWRAVR